MRMNAYFKVAAALIATCALMACGGGGGGNNFAALPALLAAGAGAGATGPVTLSGVVTYDAVPNTSGALVYTSVAAKPVRGAVVEIVNAASTVIATTSTDDNGAYSASVPSASQVLVRVRAQATRSGSGPSWDVSVRDNTQSDAIYSIESPLFNSGAAAVTRDVHAPSGWSGSSYSGARAAAPFALLDTIVTAQAKVLAAAPVAVFPPLRVFWSVNNLPARGDRVQGQIGTTSFVAGSGAAGATRSIYVLGKEDVDTDEYDASVIAHEWGHYFQSAFSRDDSPGGSHSASQRVDRRLAFSEGWGNAWSGIALERANYTDAVGSAQAQGTNLDLTTGPASSPGWFRESSVHSLLWQLNRQGGFKAIHDALTSVSFKSGVPVTSIHPFAAAYRVSAPGNAALLDGLLTGQSISAAPGDPFGTGETNDGGLPLSLPMYRSATVGGGAATPCVSNLFGDDNKHGSYTFLRFTAPSAGARTFTVVGPAGSDPDLVVYGGGERGSSDAVGTTETASISLPAGDFVLAINDFNNSSANTCFSVTIN